MSKKIHLIGLLCFAALLLAACQASDTVQFSDVWARPGWKDGNSAVFFVVKNSTGEDDKILAAASDVAGAVELHKSSMVDGVMKMEKQEFIPLPFGQN